MIWNVDGLMSFKEEEEDKDERRCEFELEESAADWKWGKMEKRRCGKSEIIQKETSEK
jgi:hypothetical protein